MHFIFPIGGIGSRFADEGYIKSKPLIRVGGVFMIERVLKEINIASTDTVSFLVRKETLTKEFIDVVRSIVHDADFVAICENTRGAADTVATYIQLSPKFAEIGEFVICDCDSFVSPFPRSKIISAFEKNFNATVTFTHDGIPSIYSYCDVKNGMVQSIAEKVAISNHANVGIYAFRSLSKFIECTAQLLAQKTSQEIYISSVIALMIADNQPFENISVSEDSFRCMGTPLQVKIFEPEKKTIAFMADTSLFVFDANLDCYLLQNHVYNFLMDRLGENHQIVVYVSSTLMKRDEFAVILKTASIMVIEMPYHIDILVTTMAVTPYSDLEKEIGIYRNHTSSRSFNTIRYENDTVTKLSKETLRHQIHWYRNIPSCLLNLFPRFIHSSSDRSYTIQKIKGVSLSRIYASGDKVPVKDIFESLQRIHSVKPCKENEPLSIHSLTIDKMKHRYTTYASIYAEQKDSENLYTTLIREYAKFRDELNKESQCVMHGDSVLSNIIFESTTSRLKFIDMRGEVFENSTIYGFAIYDLAKLYQSLAGYDAIINGVLQRDDLLKLYENLLQSRQISLQQIRIIAAILFFSMIPLHDDISHRVKFLRQASELMQN